MVKMLCYACEATFTREKWPTDDNFKAFTCGRANCVRIAEREWAHNTWGGTALPELRADDRSDVMDHAVRGAQGNWETLESLS